MNRSYIESREEIVRIKLQGICIINDGIIERGQTEVGSGNRSPDLI